MEDCRQLPSADVQATLLELTARSIAGAVRNDTVVLCGGGARNGALRRRLEALLPASPRLSDEFGVAAEQMEAALFAWLARNHIRKIPLSPATVTGGQERIAGAHYPR